MILGIVLLSVSTLGITVDAATYYGNGVYCNTQKCWVDWSRARSEIVDRGV
ncbi:leucocin A/sakacin P family class II bacteriocin, partial [Enterococcus faecium]|nr:leucocin A/sakacin P family class II bacteriocin [Enterococcus faecium]